MNKKSIYIIATIITTFALSLNANGQSIEDVFNRFKNSNSLRIELSQESKKYDLSIKDNKYNLKGEEVDLIFDGNNMYSYNKRSNELIIEQPSSEALMSSPANLFKLNLGSFKVNKNDENSYSLVPNNPESIGATELEVTIEGDDLKRILITTTNEESIEFIIDKVEYNSNIPSNLLKFNKQNYPNAEIIDFR